MGRAKTEERTKAADLYVNTSLTLKEIAAMVIVSPTKLGQWAKEDKWELQRTSKQNTADKIIVGWYSMLQKINEDVEENGGIPTAAQSDSMSKLADNIQKLSKKQNLSMYHYALKEFLQELMATDIAKAQIFAPLMNDFMKQKATTLSTEK